MFIICKSLCSYTTLFIDIHGSAIAMSGRSVVELFGGALTAKFPALRVDVR